MSAEVLMLIATAVLAVVAISAAVVAVRAVRRLSQAQQPAAVTPEPIRPSEEIALRAVDDADELRDVELRDVELRDVELRDVEPRDVEPRVVEGRLIVPPSQQQLVQSVLGRPGVRLTVFVHGAAYALRAESRDRIVALMRREYRRRRRERLRAGRRAVRAERPSAPSDQWLGS
jgi:hypothetical protein